MTFRKNLVSNFSIQQSVPIKHKQVYWINLPHIMRTILVFLSGFLSEKLQSRLDFPRTIAELQQRIQPKSILPKEYGGTVSWRVMSKKWITILEEHRERLLALDKMKFDESRKKKLRQ